MTLTGSMQAQKLRELGDRLQSAIDEKFAPREINTARKQRIVERMETEGRWLKRVQDKLYALANAWDTLTVPDALFKVATRATIEDLLMYDTYPERQETVCKRLHKAGIESYTYDDARAALLALGDPLAGEKTEADQLRELERQVILDRIPGFFPTPSNLIRTMVNNTSIRCGDRFLEPSAGRGDIADWVRSEFPDVQIDVVEINYTLRELLTLKGHHLIGADFLMMQPGDELYDVILMNPPFEKGQDRDHVRHAWDFLKPGGRLIAIVSASVFFNNDKKAIAFRAWLDEIGADWESLDEGAFKNGDKPTGVQTYLLWFEKPQSVILSNDQESTPTDEPESSFVEQQEGEDRNISNPLTVEQARVGQESDEGEPFMANQPSLIPFTPLPAPETVLLPVSAFLNQIEGVTPDYAESIRTYGQLYPCIVLHTEQGYEIADGRRRMASWKAIITRQHGDLDQPVVRCEVYEAQHGWTMGALIGLIGNNERRSNPVSELKLIEYLLEEGHSLQAIATATKIPLHTIEKRLKLARLIPDLRSALEDGRLAPGVAEKAAVLPYAVQHSLTETLATTGRITGADVKAARQVQVKYLTTLWEDDPAFDIDPLPVDPLDPPSTQALEVLLERCRNTRDGLITIPAMMIERALSELLAYRGNHS